MPDRTEHIVRLISTPNEREAAVIVATLDEQGIPARMSGQFSAEFRAEAPGLVHILVAEDDLARAQEVLAEARQEQRDIDWSQVDVGEPEQPADIPDTPRYWPRRAIIVGGVVVLLVMMALGSWASIIVVAAVAVMLVAALYNLLR